MKPCFWLFLFCSLAVSLAANPHSATTASGPTPVSPLTPQEQSLWLNPKGVDAVSTMEPRLIWRKEPLTVKKILELSPWDLMQIVQELSGKELPLSRFGQGDADSLTQAWRLKLASFVLSQTRHQAWHQEDLFNPSLVIWDPGYIQRLNTWGQWFIRLDRRDIVQSDISSLSPLEVQQAIEILTDRVYPIEFIMDHLEAFRAQITIHYRLVEALESDLPAHEVPAQH